jgi:hypothetical protein
LLRKELDCFAQFTARARNDELARQRRMTPSASRICNMIKKAAAFVEHLSLLQGGIQNIT